MRADRDTGRPTEHRGRYVLSESQRDVLTLWREGLDTRQIADRLGCSRGVAGERLRVAREDERALRAIGREPWA